MIELARAEAERLLGENARDLGLLAAPKAYEQVWARDAMISGLGLLVAGPEHAATHLRSLATLERHQSRLGNIPHHVSPGGIVDTTHAGAVDGSLWYILGHYAAWVRDGSRDRLAAAWESLARAHRFLQYQDSNECGLLEVHEAMDWADLFANRYQSLNPNVLWYAAHRALAHLARALGRPEAADLAAAAEDIRFKVNTLLWVGPEHPRDDAWVEANRREWRYPLSLIDAQLKERPYYLPFVAFRDYADRFDTMGNLLAILFGLASPAQSRRILDHVRAAELASPWPIRVCHPVIQPGDRDWREYYRVRDLNLPDQYHNGGAWPFVGGLYVAALVAAGRSDEAAGALARLAEMVRQSRSGGEWEFNEWFHGKTGLPMGVARQSWSAALFVYAHECVRRGRPPFFDEGW